MGTETGVFSDEASCVAEFVALWWIGIDNPDSRRVCVDSAEEEPPSSKKGATG